MQTLNEHDSYCPYCGEPIQLLVDSSAGEQNYIEDCQVCCRPIQVLVTESNSGEISINLQHENE